MNDSKKNDQLTDQDRPTGLMGTQFALNIAQGVLDAIEEAQVSKSQMLLWDQKELRATSKKVTQKFLGLVKNKEFDPLYEKKLEIEKFFKEYFNRTIDWSRFPLLTEWSTIEDFFADITTDQILEAYVNKFGKDKMYFELNHASYIISKEKFVEAFCQRIKTGVMCICLGSYPVIDVGERFANLDNDDNDVTISTYGLPERMLFI